MKYKKLYIALLLISIWSFSFSQQFTNYTTDDGLPSNHIYKIAQDQKGFLWFATAKGLVKYNGNTFKVFTTKDGLANNDVWGIFPTPDNKLWYLSKSSKLGYIENDSVYGFESEQKGEIFSPIFSSQVDNSIILTGSNKFHILKDEKWHNPTDSKTEDLIRVAYVKHAKVSSFTTNTAKDSIFIRDKNKTVIEGFEFKDVLENKNVRGQITDSLFYWVNNKEYAFLNLNTLKLYRRNFKNEINIETSKYVRINLINNRLQISGSGFVGMLDTDFHITNTYYIPKELKAHFGFIDKVGSIWLSTFTNGIYHLPKEKQQVKYCLSTETVSNISYVNDKIIANVFDKGFYKYDDTKKEFVQFIAEDDYIFDASYIKALDAEYYLSKSSVIIAKNNKIEKLDFLNNVNDINDKIRQLVYHDDYFYTRFAFGMNKINPNNYSIETQYNQQGINQIFLFNQKLLVATSSGLKEFIDEEFQSIPFTNQDLNRSILNLKAVSEDDILINTDGFGAYISDLKTIKQLPGSEFQIVNNAFIEDNIIWLATESGILKYTKSNGGFSLQLVIDKNNGLSSNSVSNVIVYKNQLMASTDKGIVILPKDVKNETHLLDVYIDKATYNKRDILADYSVFKYQKNNNLNFNISHIDFSSGYDVFSYKYKLKPIQKDWVTTTTNNFSFNNLQPGKYTLHIDAGSAKKQLSFTIKPLWWQAIWVKGFMVLLSIFLIVLISRFFVKRSQFKRNQQIYQDKRLSELQLKALRFQMNPHFVFNSLSAIQYYIGENNFEASETYLVKFSKLIRQFFELSKENEISLATEISVLNNYLEIEKLRFKEKLNFTINIDEKLDKESITIPTMLLQPIVENAVNHGVFNKMDNGLITLNFVNISPLAFKVEIIDDGVGFVNTKKRTHKEVKSSNVLKDRLHFLNSSEKWNISYSKEEMYPDREDKGNKSIFIIEKNK
ncbi:sensor histidine kinase [Algibacter lectus]|uniref:Two component regulator with propeller domain n=1 Tax=Algibacter lectus TaxID=221126 RepID=A0A4R8MB47_9FLAO|nr:histidine kinase [Algibacter lectus]MWW25655.1 hypothetical protein [Algibacter lectus]TDY60936.1 two component regulator with propeller domain [Algibacter lectus]